MVTIGSRTIRPLPKVTTRAPGSRRVSVTKPGTSRVCSAPTSLIAAQTLSGRAFVRISLRTEAIAQALLSEPSVTTRPRPPLSHDRQRIAEEIGPAEVAVFEG